MKLYSRFFVLMICLYHYTYAGQLPEGFQETILAENLDPTTMAIAPDGRIFITEKNGNIRILENDTLLETPFLSIEVDNYNERGLSGFVFDPDFETNNFIYIYYTVKGENHNRVSRFLANGNSAIPDSETILLDLDPLAGTIHNGGAMLFGTDGKLYIAVGDGAEAANAQDMDNLLGKILRINKDGSIPEDNPFFHLTSGKNRAIWALGLRNPFTMAIQAGTGRIYANDVGGRLFEEINHIEKGKNYGWPLIEGYKTSQTAPENYQDPVCAYGHEQGCAITGAAFYHPVQPQFPSAYTGKFFFADYCAGYIKVLNPETGSVEDTFATNIDRPVSIKVSKEGTLYYLARAGMGGGSKEDNTISNEGSLWKVTYTGSGAPAISRQPGSLLLPKGENALFSVQVTGRKPLEYQWMADGEKIEGATDTIYVLENVSMSDSSRQFYCIISNNFGTVTSDTAILHVTANTKPIVIITEPQEDKLYQAGDTLFFRGHATDAEDGNLRPEALTWKIDFHHDAHTHPALAPLTGVNSGHYIVPRVGETDDNVWYRIYLTAKDSKDLTHTVYREVLPKKRQITLATEPAGLQLNLDGTLVETPYTFNSVVGATRTLAAPLAQENETTLYAFKEWQDIDLQRLFTLDVPDMDTTFTASFQEIPKGSGKGLYGTYYNQDKSFDGAPVLTRTDSLIDFDWELDSPVPGSINNENFTIRWQGFVLPQFSEAYTFHVTADDGVRLWVDSTLVIDKWISQPATEWSGTISLTAGTQYPIRLEYFEEAGHASITLSWSSAHITKQVIPTSQLFSDLITSLNTSAKEADLSLYPVPSANALYVNLPGVPHGQIHWTVLDNVGKICLQGTAAVHKEKVLKINTSQLPSGIYLLMITKDQFSLQPQKFMKR